VIRFQRFDTIEGRTLCRTRALANANAKGEFVSPFSYGATKITYRKSQKDV
jgi:hypothetical protein